MEGCYIAMWHILDAGMRCRLAAEHAEQLECELHSLQCVRHAEIGPGTLRVRLLDELHAFGRNEKEEHESYRDFKVKWL